MLLPVRGFKSYREYGIYMSIANDRSWPFSDPEKPKMSVCLREEEAFLNFAEYLDDIPPVAKQMALSLLQR
jgi:hypothetical protein